MREQPPGLQEFLVPQQGDMTSPSKSPLTTRKDLNMKPYKILRLHKVTNQQTTARIKMGRLLVGKPNAWAPYSPDCSPCDFFLWGLLKDKVYQPIPKQMASLKRKIKI